MSLTTSNITGRVPLPTNEPTIRAVVTFTLVGYDTQGRNAIPSGADAVFTLNRDAEIQAGAKLWRNTAGLRGTVYRMTATWFEPSNMRAQKSYSFGYVQVGDAADYTIADLLNSAPPDAVPDSWWSSITQEQYDEVIEAVDSVMSDRMAAEQAAAEADDARDQVLSQYAHVESALSEKVDAGSMFHRADDEQMPISVSDDNQVLLGLDQFAEPLAPFASSRSLDRKADAGAGFYTGETDSINPVFTMGDNGRQVVGIVSDADGNLGFPWRLTFYVGDSDFEFAKIDETGVVLEGWDEAFRRIYPAGGDEVDFSNLPISARSAADSQPWNDRWSIRVKRPLGDPYTVPVDAMFPTHRAIYDRCDALVAEYSDYITRTVIGQSVGGNDIVMYRATPPNYVRISGLTLTPPVRPKIILMGSTHSNEKHCVMANTAFFEGLVRDWRTREHLSELRWGCDLIYVPCVNPDGFDRNIRRNGNNVDINRNYPERWSSASAGERGPSPASEPETQAIVGLFQAHPDAIAAIDHHRMFRIATGPDAGAERFLWIAAEGAPQLNIARNSVDQVMADVRRTFPFVDNGNAVTGTVTNHYGGACGLYAQSLGIPGFLFETPEDVGTGMMNADVVYYAEQALITFIANLYRRERRRIEDQ